MWQTFKTEFDAIAHLTKEGYTRVGRYFERGEMHISFARVEVGQCKGGAWATSHVEHNVT